MHGVGRMLVFCGSLDVRCSKSAHGRGKVNLGTVTQAAKGDERS